MSDHAESLLKLWLAWWDGEKDPEQYPPYVETRRHLSSGDEQLDNMRHALALDRVAATPRTDAVEFYAGDLDGGQEAVPADFARQLERELKAENKMFLDYEIGEKLGALANRLMATTEFGKDAHTVFDAAILLMKALETIVAIRETEWLLRDARNWLNVWHKNLDHAGFQNATHIATLEGVTKMIGRIDGALLVLMRL